jgi:hypothetical protein
MSDNTSIKYMKHKLYKLFINNKIIKIHDIDDKPKYKYSYEIQLGNISKIYHDNQNIINVINSILEENITNINDDDLFMSLSPVWNYLLPFINNKYNNHISITWSNNLLQKRHNTTKFGTNSILFIDRLTIENVEQLKQFFLLAAKNGIKYNYIVLLFDDEYGTKELIKYYKPNLQIISIFKLKLLLNYYENEKKLNDYQIESIRYQQDLIYNKVITILKNEYRIAAKTFNYQSKHDKYIIHNKKILHLLNSDISNIKINNKDLELFLDTSSTFKKNENNLNVDDEYKNRKNGYKKLQNNINLIENISYKLRFNKMIVNFSNLSYYNDFIKDFNTLVNLINEYKKQNVTLTINVIINIKLLQNISMNELLRILKIKDKYKFNFILDIPSYDLLNIKLEVNMYIDRNIISLYNLLPLLKYSDNNIYNHLNSIIDYLILDIKADTINGFNTFLETLSKSKIENIGIILRFSDNILNLDNYLNNRNTWDKFNTFLVHEELINNINIVGLFNDTRFKFHNFELNKAVVLLNNYTNNHNLKNIISYNKKYKYISTNIVSYDIFVNIMYKYINKKNNIDYDSLFYDKQIDNIDFKISNELQDLKELENINDEIESTKDKNNKNKELLEDEDEYNKINIISNILNIIAIENLTLLNQTKTYITKMFKKEENLFINWYNNIHNKTSNMDKLQNYINYIVNYSFNYIKNLSR